MMELTESIGIKNQRKVEIYPQNNHFFLNKPPEVNKVNFIRGNPSEFRPQESVKINFQ